MNIVKIDGRYIKTKEQLHDCLEEEFDLPSYYGRNLDALWDLLSEKSKPTKIIIENYEELEKNLNSYAENLKDLFLDLEEEFGNFEFSFNQ